MTDKNDIGSVKVFADSEGTPQVSIHGMYIGPADELLRFVYAGLLNIQRERLFPVPMMYLEGE